MRAFQLGRIHPEKQYLCLVDRILRQGRSEQGRNGTTRVLLGETLKFPLTNNTLPLLTTKKLAWRTCLKELLWFIRGDTSNTTLVKQNVHIWSDNATRDFLDSRGLHQREEGDLGPIYGHQWRFFNAKYKTSDDDYRGKGVDQLSRIITALKDPEERYSRRLILSAWNPLQINEMALPPCHVLSQFHVTNSNELTCTLYQRSGDVGLGIPFNIASYSFLTHLLAHHCGLVPKQLIHFIANAHIYDDHEQALRKQLDNYPRPFPKLLINNIKDNIEDYKINDMDVISYDPHPIIKMKMRP
jgi:thymidylate synthase